MCARIPNLLASLPEGHASQPAISATLQAASNPGLSPLPLALVIKITCKKPVDELYVSELPLPESLATHTGEFQWTEEHWLIVTKLF